MTELIQAKRVLLKLLLGTADLTDTEIELMYVLSRDEDIQKLLDEAGKRMVAIDG